MRFTEGVAVYKPRPWDQQSGRMTVSALAVRRGEKVRPQGRHPSGLQPTQRDPGPGRDGAHLPRRPRQPGPVAHLASMKTAEALSIPVEDRYRQVETTRLAQSEQTQREHQELARSHGAAVQGGLRMMA